MKAVTVVALLASMAVTTIAQAQTYQWVDGYAPWKATLTVKNILPSKSKIHTML